MKLRKAAIVVATFAFACGCGSSILKWGFIDRTGAVVIEPQFASAREFSEGLAPVQVNRRWGYIDATGKMVIQPRFGQAEPFSQGLALVTTAADAGDHDTRYGFIDRSGEFVIPEQFGWAQSFSEDLAAACAGECGPRGRPMTSLGYIDRKGAFVIKPQFGGAQPFSEGLATATDGSPSWGYVDKKRTFVIPPSFRRGSKFSGGLASTDQGYIDKTGAIVIRHRAPGEPFSDGLALIQYALLSNDPRSKDNRAEFIDKSGKVVLTARLCSSSFSEGLAASCDDHFSYGFIDKAGRFVIPPKWDEVRNFSSGLAAVCVGCGGS